MAGEKLVVKVNKEAARKRNTEQEERLSTILDEGIISQGFEAEN